MTIRYIEHNGQKQYAVVPVELFEDLLEKAEMLDDIRAFDAATATDDETIPMEMVKRFMNGENRLKVWREYRVE